MKQAKAETGTVNPSRHKVWDRWRELTRFRFACEMSLDLYSTYVGSLPVRDPDELTIVDPVRSRFECSLTDFRSTLNGREQLYRVLLPAYMGLVEELGREIVVEMISKKRVPRTNFPNLDQTGDLDDAVAAWITKTAIEVWGKAIVDVSDRKFPEVEDRKGPLVAAAVSRNLCVHGLTIFNDKAVARLPASGKKGAPYPNAGDGFVLDQGTFLGHVDALLGFARLIAGVVSTLKVKSAAS